MSDNTNECLREFEKAKETLHLRLAVTFRTGGFAGQGANEERL